MSFKAISLNIISEISKIDNGITIKTVDASSYEEVENYISDIHASNYDDYKDKLGEAEFTIPETTPTKNLLKKLSEADIAKILPKLVSCNYITNHVVIVEIVEILLNLKSAQKKIGELAAAPVAIPLALPQRASSDEIEAGSAVVKLCREQIIQAIENDQDPSEYIDILARLALNQKYNEWNQGINILSGALISVSKLGQSISEFFKKLLDTAILKRIISEKDGEIQRLLVKNAEIAVKDAVIAAKDAEIARLSEVAAVAPDGDEDLTDQESEDEDGDEALPGPHQPEGNEEVDPQHLDGEARPNVQDGQIRVRPDAEILPDAEIRVVPEILPETHNWVGLGLCGTILTFALATEKLYYIMSEWDDVGIILFGNFVFCPILMMFANWMSYRAISEFITVKFDAPLFRQVYQATDMFCALYIAFYRFYTGENNFSVSRLPTQAFYIIWAWFAALVIFHIIISVRAIYSVFRDFCAAKVNREEHEQLEEIKEKWIYEIIWRLISQWVRVLADWNEVFYSMKIVVITLIITAVVAVILFFKFFKK